MNYQFDDLFIVVLEYCRLFKLFKIVGINK